MQAGMWDMTKRTLGKLAIDIREAHELCRAAAGSALAHAVTAGRLLLQAKAALPHGTWGDWLADNCGFSERTAQAYMRIAGRVEELSSEWDPQRAADLSVREALRLLKAPSPAKSEKERAEAECAEFDRLAIETRLLIDGASARLAELEGAPYSEEVLREVKTIIDLAVRRGDLHGEWMRRMLQRLGRLLNDLVARLKALGFDEAEADKLARAMPAFTPERWERFHADLAERLAASVKR